MGRRKRMRSVGEKKEKRSGFGGGGKPEKLRTKEIKLMSFLEAAESARALANWIFPCVDGGPGMLCFAGVAGG